MNKELYIKTEKLLEEVRSASFLEGRIRKFLEDNENKFKKEESIKALKKIRAYFELKEKMYQECERRYEEVYKEFRSTCQHEVAIKYNNRPYYHCLICNSPLGHNSDIIPETSIISIDTTNDYKVGYIIKEIFEEIIYSDKDLVETINEVLEEMQYDRDIKVYRRSK